MDCASLTGKESILEAAAQCFMNSGYSETSIDDVAEHLGATKGKVYHYYRSKADLFFDVQHRGMAINIEAIEPIANGSKTAIERFSEMCHVHLNNMLNSFSYQRVVSQGVEMHLGGATTPKQREKLKVLMKEREHYEGLFRKVLEDGQNEGIFQFEDISMASKAVLAILNNPVLWYNPNKSKENIGKSDIVEQFSQFALRSVSSDQTGRK